jgi:hypothetical protein
LKKILYISLSTLLCLNLFANNSLLLKKIPLDNKFLSTENGGDKYAIDAYSDGVGIYTIGLEDKKFSSMNQLVFSHGDEAKKNEEPLKEFVLSNGTEEEKTLASFLGMSAIETVIGDSCNDGNDNTIFDKYIDINGTCEGTPAFTIGAVCNDNNELTTLDKYIDIYGTCEGTPLPTCLTNERYDSITGLCTPIITPENCLNGYAGDSEGIKSGYVACYCATNITSSNWSFLKKADYLRFSCADTYYNSVFQHFTNLVNFNGLKNIEELKNLELVGSSTSAPATTISNFSGLDKLKTMEGLKILGKHSIQNFSGLNNLEHSSEIFIDPQSNNGIYHVSSFNSFEGLNKLSSVGTFKIQYARNLTSLNGLENLKTANELYFNTVNTSTSSTTSAISNISALSNLEYVSNTVTIEHKNYSIKLAKDSYLCNEGWIKMRGIVRTYNSMAGVYYAGPTTLNKSNICYL